MLTHKKGMLNENISLSSEAEILGRVRVSHPLYAQSHELYNTLRRA
jgi:hypothetical protein